MAQAVFASCRWSVKTDFRIGLSTKVEANNDKPSTDHQLSYDCRDVRTDVTCPPGVEDPSDLFSAAM